MDDLFASHSVGNDLLESNAPLADRMRPKTLDDVMGQKHLLGETSPLRKLIEKKSISSMIFWGPPGVGKTTIALLIANYAECSFIRISAVEAGVKDIRQVIETAKINLKRSLKKTVLFIDEIHRFNKSQQDALLHAVEKGIITLIGATTENPSFEVNSALLSRCQVYRLALLTDDEIAELVNKALKEDSILSNFEIELNDMDFLTMISAGDARTALNAVELAVNLSEPAANKIVINRSILEKALQQKTAQYDKNGESHYDTISAFIKSMRGSDPDAAVFWLAKMIDAGEDPKFIARRMVIFASEDIGNADPFALTLSISVFQAVEMIGLPEARINLSQGVTYLASCPKSNASYIAINNALADISKGADISVPLHLRNAPTKLMKAEGYGAGYKYPHDFEAHFVRENYFPTAAKTKQYYHPGVFGKERLFKERLDALWGEKREKKP